MNITLLRLSMLFRPSYWIMNHPYSQGWDEELWNLMSYYKFEKIDGFTAKLGDREIWIENHPYASFRPRESYKFSEYTLPQKIRPRRITIYLAHKKYIYDILNEKEGENP